MTFWQVSLTKWCRLLAATGLCAFLSFAAHADEQGDRILALENRLDQSLKLVESLAARLADLERGRGNAVTATLPAPTMPASGDLAGAADRVARLQATVNQLSEGMSLRGGDGGLPVHGFADVGGGWSRGSDPERLRGFNGGTLDLYLTPQFGDRVRTLIELAVEYGGDGALAVDMERLQIGYTVSDSLTLWAGRFHTPFGLWNTSFHHGANLQNAISRPRFIDFEDKGGIIAAHSVGLWASSKIDTGAGKLSVDAYVANGPSIRARTLDFNPFTDNSANKLVGLNVGYRPRGASGGLSLGLHGFASQVDAFDNAGGMLSQTRLRMMGGYVGYDADDWELIAESYEFRNAGLNSPQRYDSQAWFMQVAKTFGSWSPYLRLERARLDTRDPYFASQASGRPYRRQAAGLRYTIDARSSLKFELSRTDESATQLIDDSGAALPFAGGSYHRGLLQFSVAF